MKTIKFISWNVNGIRACVKSGFLDFLQKEKPEILAVQETKAKQEQLPDEVINPQGYNSVWFSAKKPGYSGVAVFVKKGIEFKEYPGLNMKEFDNEGRSLALELSNDLVFVTAYFPNSQDEGRRLDYKIRFCDSIKGFIDRKIRKGKKIVLCGDYNIAHTKIDLVHPEANETHAGFLPEERAWMDSFLKNGYVDTFRLFTKEGGHYTWWSYRTRARQRNAGWRLDYHCVNESFADKVLRSYHYTDVMGSDHCPVGIEIKENI